VPRFSFLQPCGGTSTVQRVSFVGYTGGEGGSTGLWTLQNLHAVLEYSNLPYSVISRLGFAHMAVHIHVGFLR